MDFRGIFEGQMKGGKFMKTWEMIKRWQESGHKKEFRVLGDYVRNVEYKKVKNCKGILCWDGHYESPLFISDNDLEWEEVIQGVGWDEAFLWMNKSRYYMAKFRGETYLLLEDSRGHKWLNIWHFRNSFEDAHLFGDMITEKEWELIKGTDYE